MLVDILYFIRRHTILAESMMLVVDLGPTLDKLVSMTDEMVTILNRIEKKIPTPTKSVKSTKVIEPRAVIR